VTESADVPRSLHVAIIGVGPGGLCLETRLNQTGLREFVLLETADRLGGTWSYSRHPGCA